MYSTLQSKSRFYVKLHMYQITGLLSKYALWKKVKKNVKFFTCNMFLKQIRLAEKNAICYGL